MRNRTICIVSAFLMALVAVGCGIAVNAGASDSTVSSATIYVPDNYATIQGAVNNAAAGDTIIVRDGTYLENVKVNKRLTIRSENGPASTIVESPEGVNDHVVAVTADHVHINGLTVKNATGKNEAGQYNYAGLYISAHHCNIRDNLAMNNAYGFFLSESSKNTLINNAASGKIGDGIYVTNSNYNTISNNTVKLNHRYGIRLYSSHNNTVRNNNVSNNGYGIRLGGSHNNTIEKNNVQSNTYDGFYLFYSNDNSFVDNTANQNNYDGFFINASYNNTLINNVANANIYDGFGLELVNNHTLINNRVNSNNKSGISLTSSNRNLLEGNVASLNTEMGFYLLSSASNTLADNKARANNEVGIHLEKSGNCSLTNNMMEGNYYNFGVTGDSLHHFYHDIDASNRVDGKPIYYWIDQQEREIPKDAGFVGIINSINITARDLTLTKNSVGLLLAYSVGTWIDNVTVSNTDDGISLFASSYSLIANNTISNNNWGINMALSNTNYLLQNTNTNNSIGIIMSLSNDNKLAENSISNNRHGISLGTSNINTFVMNNISNNWQGLALVDSQGNLFFTNNFINSSAHSMFSNTTWNSLLELTYIYNGETYTNYMGNYWSKYFKDIYGTMGIELDTDGDGIGDVLTPYTLPTGLGTDKDNYPLMQPYENYIYVSADE
ncbi:MAG: NosD domain-containing protein [Euryarchaeota archaeon]|nr:NosD domain-containing protein [Euryarchaeota archaeon]